MKMKYWIEYISITLLFIFVTVQLYSQEERSSRTTFISSGFLQIKESSNYGLVFRGPSVDFGMNWNIPHKNNLIFFEYKFGLAAMFSKGIIGMNIGLKPVDFAYLWERQYERFKLDLGPALKMEYNTQAYPDIQSGYEYWLTNYSTGLMVFVTAPVKNSLVKVRAFNSFFNLVSRGDIYNDPYFFDLDFRELLRDVHQDFMFSSPGKFNNTFVAVLIDHKFGHAVSCILDIKLDNYRAVTVVITKVSIDASFQFGRSFDFALSLRPLSYFRIAVHTHNILTDNDRNTAQGAADRE